MERFNIKHLTERQKIAHSLFERARETFGSKDICEKCKTEGYVYVDYNGDFEQYGNFLDEFADEIEKTTSLLKKIRLEEMEELLKDPNITNNLDLFVNMPIDFMGNVYKAGNSLAIVIPKRKCEELRIKDKDEVAIIARKLKGVKA